MAQTSGQVQSLNCGSLSQCAWVGQTPASAEVLIVTVAATDDVATVALKSQMMDALGAALVSRNTVLVNHGDQDANITSVVVNPI